LRGARQPFGNGSLTQTSYGSQTSGKPVGALPRNRKRSRTSPASAGNNLDRSGNGLGPTSPQGVDTVRNRSKKGAALVAAVATAMLMAACSSDDASRRHKTRRAH